MRYRILFLPLLLLFFTISQGSDMMQKHGRSAYYAALRSGKIEDINNEIANLNNLTGNEKEALEGTLLMRKAGLVKIPAEKLKLFKAGRIKLETVLSKDSTNTEYRFLRLIIQEHAPKIIKYNKQLQSDKIYIQKTFKSLDPAVQHAIEDYSKGSEVLRPQDL